MNKQQGIILEAAAHAFEQATGFKARILTDEPQHRQRAHALLEIETPREPIHFLLK
jgi:hypothetical protein